MNRFALRARAVPPSIRALIGGVPLLLSAYWCAAYAGPYRWLAEAQLEALGGYEVVLTGALVFLMAMLPAGVLVQLVATHYLARDAPGAEAARRAGMQRKEARIVANVGYIFAGVLFLGAGGAAVYFLLLGLTAGAPVAIAARSLEQGVRPKSRQVIVSGKLRPDLAMSIVESTGSTDIEKVYVPIVSPAWQAGQPVTVFLETYQTGLDFQGKELAPGPYEGMIAEDGLPGMVRASIAAKGLLPKGPHWVVHYRASAGQYVTMGLVFLTVAGIVAVLTSAVALLRRPRGLKCAPADVS